MFVIAATKPMVEVPIRRQANRPPGGGQRLLPALAFLAIVSLVLVSARGARAQQSTEPPPTFESLLKEISSAPPDACTYPGKDFSDLEFHLFDQADKALVQELNETSNGALGETLARAKSGPSGSPNVVGGGPRARAMEAVAKLEHLSAEINRSWPEEKRLHFEALDLPPALVVKMTYRNRATFSFFAMPQRDAYAKPTKLWQAVGALDDHRVGPAQGYEDLTVFPLRRGPSRRARFLAKFGVAGCGSGYSLQYYAYEWDPQGTGHLDEVIKLEGAASQEDRVDQRQSSQANEADSFPPIGELRTTGSLITLPYCWYSAIDTWDNPSLCAVNSYDISADHVRFVGSSTNRPDVAAVAKAIEYAQAHDFPALLAYCGSPAVARRIIEIIPPNVTGAGGWKIITRISSTHEKMELSGGYYETLRFDVEKRGDRWLVVALTTE